MKKHTYYKVSILLYLISFGLPVYGMNWEFLGYKAAYMGWLAFPASEYYLGIPWLANILFIISVVMWSKYLKLQLSLAILTIVLSLFVYVNYKQDLIPGLGFFVWFSSFVLMLIHKIRAYKRTSIA
jgi:hypothetical protein